MWFRSTFRGFINLQRQPWVEIAWLVSGLATYIWVTSQSAFDSPFFGENFQHLGLYRHLGNCLLCLFVTPTLDGWLRPVDGLFTVISFETLPLDPLAHHVRNFTLLIVNLILLHILLLAIIPERIPRLLGVGLVGVSRVHFTLVGYINLFGSILVVTWILLAALLIVSYVKHRWIGIYVLGVVACWLAVFTKETGISVLVVIAGLLYSYDKLAGCSVFSAKRWAPYLIPVSLGVMTLFIARTLITGSPTQTGEFYAPQVSLDVLWRDGIAFSDRGAMGPGGIGAYIAALTYMPPIVGVVADALALLSLVILFIIVWHRTGSSRRTWIFPIAWMGSVFGLVITVRNLQIYYTYEFTVAFGILLATLANRVPGKLQALMAGAVIFIAFNGAVSTAFSTYNWQVVAHDAGEALRHVRAACTRPVSCRQLTFVTSKPGHWRFTLGGTAPLPPLLPELLDVPQLNVRYVEADAVGPNRLIEQRSEVIFYIDQGFSRRGTDEVELNAPPFVVSFGPERAKVGEPFNLQTNNTSGLWFVATGLTPDTVVLFNGRPLTTVVELSQGIITAQVDVGAYPHAGTYSIYLLNRVGESNKVMLIVEP
jgi:hypothetical protein